jgi:GT2 family glycosyltransferase
MVRLPKVYAIVVTYNGLAWINKCLKSLLNSSIPLKIIVIDNCSSDGTTNIVQQEFPEITLIKSKENIGFGKANNIGIIKAIEDDADFIVLVNQDVWIEMNTVEVLINIAEKNPQFGILTGLHLDGLNEELDFNFSKLLHPDITPDFISDHILNKPKILYESEFINAAFWLITRQCYNSVGLFEPLFKMYGEDYNYVDRVHYKGFKVGVSSSTAISHDRKKRKGKFSINVNRVQLNFLLKTLNPNNNFYVAYTYGFKRLFIEMFKSILRLNLSLALKFIRLIINNLTSLNKFKQARRLY